MAYEPERLDLSPLDPIGDRRAYDRLVRRIMEAAGPELARRAADRGPIALVAGWARPALAAAAVIAVIAIAAIAATERAAGEAGEAGTVADALGVPAPAAEWLEEGREPTPAELILAAETP